MNLKQLSQALGMSQTTVSRAINGYPEVGAKTRERVLKMAAKYNYQPNRIAKTLATGRTGHLGIIFPVERNLLLTPLFHEFLSGVSELLIEKSMDLTIIPVKTEHEIQAYADLAISSRVDGVMLSTPLRNDPRIATLTKMGMPFVVHGRLDPDGDGRHIKNASYAFVDIDNQGAFFKAAEYLIRSGHKHIALVNDDTRFTFAYHRLLGYQQALLHFDVAFESKYVYSVEMTEEKGYLAAVDALSQSVKPSAFLASSIFQALGIRRAIQQQGYSLEKDITVVVHDDKLPYLQLDKFDPPMARVESSIAYAGYLVASQLCHLIETGEKRQKILDVDLVVPSESFPEAVMHKRESLMVEN